MRVKIGNFLVRHDGIEYGKGDIFEIGKRDGKRLISSGVAVETTEKVTGNGGEADLEALLNTKDLNTLKVDKLKAICQHMGLPVSGNKSELIEAIEAASELEEIDDDETAEPETLVPDSE